MVTRVGLFELACAAVGGAAILAWYWDAGLTPVVIALMLVAVYAVVKDLVTLFGRAPEPPKQSRSMPPDGSSASPPGRR